MKDERVLAKKTRFLLFLFVVFGILPILLGGCSARRQVILNGQDISKHQGRPFTIRLVKIYSVPEGQVDLWTETSQGLVLQLEKKGYSVVGNDAQDYDATVYVVFYARYQTQSQFKYMINGVIPVSNVHSVSIDTSFLIEDRFHRPVNFFQWFASSPHSLNVSPPNIQQQVSQATYKQVNETFIYTRFAEIVEASLGLAGGSLFDYLVSQMEEDNLPKGLDWQVADVFTHRVLGSGVRWLLPLKRGDELYKRWLSYSFVFSNEDLMNEHGYKTYAAFLKAHPSEIGKKQRMKALGKLEKLNGY